ncbi:MAG: GTP cyclohydrolase FolE2 [Patescibacteria group bacterium]|jgi:GTP cyclohydrolase I
MLVDTQAQESKLCIKIHEVGISNLKMPCTLKTDKEDINTVANFNFSTSLHKNIRGTHMSRLVQIIHKFIEKPLGRDELLALANNAKDSLASGSSLLKADFCYFKTKTTPITKIKNILNYQCGVSIYSNCKVNIIADVEIPVTSLCPCSKEISENGAHNQRGLIKIRADISDNPEIWFDDLIELGETSSSCDIYSVLKRPDEKYVTEKAYDNPKFVEDVAREVAYGLKKLNIKKYVVNCVNYESIHGHNAYAIIRKGILCS